MGKVRLDRHSNSIQGNEIPREVPRYRTMCSHLWLYCLPCATLSPLRANPKESHLVATETEPLSGGVHRQGRATWRIRALNLTVTLQKISTLALQVSSSKPENHLSARGEGLMEPQPDGWTAHSLVRWGDSPPQLSRLWAEIKTWHSFSAFIPSLWGLRSGVK